MGSSRWDPLGVRTAEAKPSGDPRALSRASRRRGHSLGRDAEGGRARAALGPRGRVAVVAERAPDLLGEVAQAEGARGSIALDAEPRDRRTDPALDGLLHGGGFDPAVGIEDLAPARRRSRAVARL